MFVFFFFCFQVATMMSCPLPMPLPIIPTIHSDFSPIHIGVKVSSAISHFIFILVKYLFFNYLNMAKPTPQVVLCFLKLYFLPLKLIITLLLAIRRRRMIFFLLASFLAFVYNFLFFILVFSFINHVIKNGFSFLFLLWRWIIKDGRRQRFLGFYF